MAIRTVRAVSPEMQFQRPTYSPQAPPFVGSKRAASASVRNPAPTPTMSAEDSNAKQRKYERKSKRFLWPDELHRLFVAAIFDVGLKNASPKALLTIMVTAGATAALTTEHLKSHLQKYRLNYDRSRAEFLEYYDASVRHHLKRRRTGSRDSAEQSTAFVFPVLAKEEESGSDAGENRAEGYQDAMAMATTKAAGEERTEAATESMKRTAKTHKSKARTRSNATSTSASPVGKDPVSMSPCTSTSSVTSISSSASTSDALSSKSVQLNNNAAAALAMSRAMTMPSGPGPAFPKPSVNDAALMAAAAASLQSYPPLMNVGLDVLNDPQWHLLNSLMPFISASPNNMVATSTAGTSTTPSLSVPGPVDLMQMHLDMQAQMNLHRQMYTRKEVVSKQALPTTAPAQPTLPTSSYQSGIRNEATPTRQGARKIKAAPARTTTTTRPIAPATASATSISANTAWGGSSNNRGDFSGGSQAMGVSTELPATTTTATAITDPSGVSAMPLDWPEMGGNGPLGTTLSGESDTTNRMDDSNFDLVRWDHLDEMNLDDDLFGFLEETTP